MIYNDDKYYNVNVCGATNEMRYTKYIRTNEGCNLRAHMAGTFSAPQGTKFPWHDDHGVVAWIALQNGNMEKQINQINQSNTDFMKFHLQITNPCPAGMRN